MAKKKESPIPVETKRKARPVQEPFRGPGFDVKIDPELTAMGLEVKDWEEQRKEITKKEKNKRVEIGAYMKAKKIKKYRDPDADILIELETSEPTVHVYKDKGTQGSGEVIEAPGEDDAISVKTLSGAKVEEKAKGKKDPDPEP